jgi:hypothetical protein
MSNKVWYKIIAISGVISCFVGGINLGLGEAVFGGISIIVGWFSIIAAHYFENNVKERVRDETGY